MTDFNRPMMATIAVEGIRVKAFHGVYDIERQNGNDFVIDLYLRKDISQAAHTDALSDTLDYQVVHQLVLTEMKTPANLLEHLVVRMGRRMMREFQGLASLKVRLTKLHPIGMESVKQTYVEMLFDNTGAD